METPSPAVTVLLPVRNGAAHLRAALESIFAQTFRDFELLVIDDGSTDATPEILRAVRDPRLRVITHAQNLGLVPTLNEGLDRARGELIARQDHDDLSHPDRLRKQVDFLRAHPACALVGAEAWQTDAAGRVAFRLLRPGSAGSIRWHLCFDNAFIHSTVLFRRAIIRDECGGYPRSLHSEDYALWSRVARAHPTANLLEPLLYFREHAASATGVMSTPESAAFDQATGLIREENLRALFAGEGAVEDARVLSTYRRDFGKHSAAEFVRVFDRLNAQAPPQLRAADDWRRTCALQLAEIAYRLLPVARGPALAMYRRAFGLHPPLARVLPWPRIAALLVFGHAARRLYTAFIGR